MPSRYRSSAWGTALLALSTAAVLASPACRAEGRRDRAPPEPTALAPERGAELYRTNCAVCHGERGAGDGPAYPWLFPAPRDFTAGRFRLVSTDNGVPTDEDLLRTLRRGMPGSAMVSWGWLPEEDLASLVAHVRRLAVEGLARRPHDRSEEERSGIVTSRALHQAQEALRPGRVLTPARGVPPDAAILERGVELYAAHCAACHAEDGTGDPTPRLDEDGRLNWARDFTAGYLKGGARPQDLSWRIRAGIPGTAMPPASFLVGEDLEALVAHVRELIPEGSDERRVHRRQGITARRVEAIPTEPEDVAWQGSTPVDVVLSPLSWSQAAVPGVEVEALHDGARIAIRLRWEDATHEGGVLSDLLPTDALALQFSRADRPALFGMGSREHPTNIWHWRAQRAEDVVGALDLLERPPHVMGEAWGGRARLDVPLYHRELERPPPASEVDSLRVEGVGRAPGELRSADPVEVAPRWVDGVWEVVFTRALELSDSDEVPLAPGARVRLAFAVWNGAAGDQRGRKSISIWHELRIQE